MPESIPTAAHHLLDEPNFCHVSTLRDDGTVQPVLVWCDRDGDTVLLNTSEGRAWWQHVQEDPRVSLLVADRENPYEFVSIRGRVAQETTDGADPHIDALAKQYMGVDEYPLRQEGEVRTILRVEADHVFHMKQG